MKSSQFRMYSLGIVVETKPPGTDYILVSPMEELSIQNSGLIFEQEEGFRGSKRPITSTHFKSEHTSKNYVRAKWQSIGNGNRTSAPDVYIGETVVIYKYGNVDEYFWDDIGREPILRRLEDVLYSFSNKSGGITQEEYDKDTSYWVQVSTRDKFIHIHSSDNDGEACTYDIRIDTAAGKVRIEDGLGNFTEWDSPAGTHTTVMNTEIIRRAPKITDYCETHTVNTEKHIINSNTIEHSANSITNDANNITNKASVVNNTGDVNTQGKDFAAGGNFNPKP